MPSLDRLAGRLPEKDFAIIPVTKRTRSATRHRGRPSTGWGCRAPETVSRSRGQARDQARRARLPDRLIIGRDGAPLAYREGAAEWDGDAMVAKLEALAARSAKRAEWARFAVLQNEEPVASSGTGRESDGLITASDRCNGDAEHQHSANRPQADRAACGRGGQDDVGTRSGVAAARNDEMAALISATAPDRSSANAHRAMTARCPTKASSVALMMNVRFSQIRMPSTPRCRE